MMKSMCTCISVLFVGVSAVQLNVTNVLATTKNVLFFGSSLDRNAVTWYCKGKDSRGEYLSMRWCNNTEDNVNVGFIFHPGVGLNGDMEHPFYSAWHGNWKKYHPSTAEQMNTIVWNTMTMLKTAEPDLVVVDSSLWDIAVWKDFHNFTDQRVDQWCNHDLRNLLESVSEKFPKSHVVYRTAPTVMKKTKQAFCKFEPEEVARLYDALIHSGAYSNGKLYGKYEVIDYRKIMEDLIAKESKERPMKSLFKEDGYHPAQFPSTLYMNQILRRVGVNKIDNIHATGGNDASTGLAEENVAACHTAVKGEECHFHVQWAMGNGIHKNPEWYKGLTEKSTFEDFQEFLHKIPEHPAHDQCPIPCRTCHTAVPGEKCHRDATWAMDHGFRNHPEWYTGFTNDVDVGHAPTFEDFQRFLNADGSGDCPVPCSKVEGYKVAGKPASNDQKEAVGQSGS